MLEGGGCLDHSPHHREDQVLLQLSQQDLTCDTVNFGPEKEDELGTNCVPRKIEEY
jgi:hypothetical protein